MKLYKLIIVVSAVLFLSACKKDILDRTPQDRISDAEFWKTTSDLQLYCNSFYSRMLPTYTGFGTTGIYGLDADLGSDNMITMSYNTILNAESTVPSSGSAWSWTGSGWASWGELRNINYFLANYTRVSGDPTAINPYVGEALFFRAAYYFSMLKSYGALPWINKPLLPSDSSLIYSARLPRNIIADSILADLDRAITLLPTKSKALAMRVTKEIAMAFQSRVALFEGTWEKYHAGTPFGVTGSNGSQFLTKAATVAETLITSGVHTLDNVGAANGYWRIFNQFDHGGSKEVMFWRKYSSTDNPKLAHNWHRYTISGAGRGVTKNLVDAYLCTDGKPISASPLYQGDDSLMRVAANRDPRLAQTIYLPDGNHIITSGRPGGAPNIIFTVPSFEQSLESKSATGYQLYKGHNSDDAQQNASEVGTTALIFIRYAEVLLNFAEAKAELGTLTQADVDKSINKLRQRVGMPNLGIAAITVDPNWEFPALSPVINEVRRERRVELACEGFRRDDIYRWAAADELLFGWKPKGAKKNQWTTVVAATILNAYPVDANGYIELFKNVGAMATGYKFNVNRDYLSPIPTNELTLNPKLLPQNPGW